MNKDTELLNYIYQNAKMGIIGIDNIKNEIESEELLAVIREQQKDYYEICNQATKTMLENNEDIKDISSIAKLMTYFDAKLNTFDNKSNTNIAKMMMKGSNKGIIEIQEKLNNYKGADKKAISLAKDLLRIEKRNLDNLKKFL